MSTFGPDNLKTPAPLTGYAAVIAENLRLIASRKGAISAEALLFLLLMAIFSLFGLFSLWLIGQSPPMLQAVSAILGN